MGGQAAKARLLHTEPAAGAVGLAMLLRRLHQQPGHVALHLRHLNPHVASICQVGGLYSLSVMGLCFAKGTAIGAFRSRTSVGIWLVHQVLWCVNGCLRPRTGAHPDVHGRLCTCARTCAAPCTSMAAQSACLTHTSSSEPAPPIVSTSCMLLRPP